MANPTKGMRVFVGDVDGRVFKEVEQVDRLVPDTDNPFLMDVQMTDWPNLEHACPHCGTKLPIHLGCACNIGSKH